MMQQGDVQLYQTVDDGDITVDGGLIKMTGGLDTAVYLSLFGGNESDDGIADNPLQWWGNIGETETAKQYHSETQNLLRSIPSTTGNLQRIRDAVSRDLAWLSSAGVARELEVSVGMPGLNKVSISVNVDGFSADYVENWKNTP